MSHYSVSQVAKLSGLPSKTIRYYDEIGLVVPERADNGYRRYREAQLSQLRFVGRARRLGFGLEECQMLLQLQDDPQRASADVKALVSHKLSELEQRLQDLTQLRDELSELVGACRGDDNPDCPILARLSALEDRAE